MTPPSFSQRAKFSSAFLVPGIFSLNKEYKVILDQARADHREPELSLEIRLRKWKTVGAPRPDSTVSLWSTEKLWGRRGISVDIQVWVFKKSLPFGKMIKSLDLKAGLDLGRV